jgi:hypothetical protein
MWKSAGRAPSKNASFTLAFALQLRKKHGKTSVSDEETQVKKNLSHYKIHTQVKKNLSHYKIHTHTLTHTHTHTHTHPHFTKRMYASQRKILPVHA